jgi:hypothetical protein
MPMATSSWCDTLTTSSLALSIRPMPGALSIRPMPGGSGRVCGRVWRTSPVVGQHHAVSRSADPLWAQCTASDQPPRDCTNQWRARRRRLWRARRLTAGLAWPENCSYPGSGMPRRAFGAR